MLSLHAADAVEPGGGRPAVPGGAVLVDGDRIAAVGPLDELAAAHPAARVRRWAGTVRPGRTEVLVLPDSADPRECGEDVRRQLHGMLRRGVTAVDDGAADGAARSALDRSGLLRGSAPALTAGARADFAAFAPDGTCLATVLAGRLVHRLA
ncbi:imidazolonepropionase-like domain-containing protein [Streptomyces sp. NPDC020917]|uniref:imidazolonepropionase-like domain-containing protein n=1 Tax=Streptomyces sp. NPDC020917 TaxID=3365102 RepID=UPI00379CCF0B